MRKRGALFYIIDAFVAASIIALTLTIIFATQLNAPKTEAAEDALDEYTNYLETTIIRNAPGTTKTTLINERLVDNPENTLIASLAQLIQRGNLTAAQQLIQEINRFMLEPQYGLNLTLHIDGTTTQLTLEKPERLDRSSIFLKKSILSTYQLQVTENIYNTSITSTGNNNCKPDTCLYIIDPAGPDYDATGCGLGFGLVKGFYAQCRQFNQTSIHTVILEASMWS